MFLYIGPLGHVTLLCKILPSTIFELQVILTSEFCYENRSIIQFCQLLKSRLN